MIEDDDQLTPLTQKDNNYEPAEDELIGYAEYIGFILPQDQHLLYLAKEGLKADLPPNWQAYGNKKGDIFYKDLTSGVIQQQHPADQLYRQKFLRQKKRLQLLATQKQIIIEQNQSDMAGSQVYGLTKTQNSQRQNTKSRVLNQAIIDQKQHSSKSVQSIQSFIQQNIQQSQMGVNFINNRNTILQPQVHEVYQLNQLNTDFIQKYSKKINNEFSKISLDPLLQKQKQYSNRKTQKFNNQINSLSTQIIQKQNTLDRLISQRIQKQKQLIQIQQQFQAQKQQIIDNYRQKLKQKIASQKKKKQKEFESTVDKITKKHSKELQRTLRRN